jgi:(p)ppGpp synthase/HD superfamily hydrolase
MNQQTNSVLPHSEPSSTQRLSSRFEEAFVFAAQRHKHQTRKGTTIPYIAHLMQVSGIALENGADEDEAIAALLHDVIEDQNETPEELTRRFGPEVTAIVAGCSDSASTDKAPWRQRKETYIAHVLTASPSVRLVSSCDKLHNARAILADYQELGDALWGRFNASAADILWYYQSLIQAFQQAQERQGEPQGRVVTQLANVVAELASLVSNPTA